MDGTYVLTKIAVKDLLESKSEADYFSPFVPTIDEDYIFDRSPEDFEGFGPDDPVFSVWISNGQTVSASHRTGVVRDYPIQVRVEKLLNLRSKDLRIEDFNNLFNTIELIQDLFEPNIEDSDDEHGFVRDLDNGKRIAWQETEVRQIDDQRLDNNIFNVDLLFTFREWR